MTAKQVITRRCADCEGRRCGFTDCALYGLAKDATGKRRETAIRRYCRWCMNGNPVRWCASPDCAIYQYRAQAEGSLNVKFEPQHAPIPQFRAQSKKAHRGQNGPQKPRIEREIRVSKPKEVKLYQPPVGGANFVPYAGGAA